MKVTFTDKALQRISRSVKGQYEDLEDWDSGSDEVTDEQMMLMSTLGEQLYQYLSEDQKAQMKAYADQDNFKGIWDIFSEVMQEWTGTEQLGF